MEPLGFTDAQKVEAVNGLQAWVECCMNAAIDMHERNDPYLEVLAAKSAMTPEELYEYEYNEGMKGYYGKYRKKEVGIEAAMAECKAMAERRVQRELVSRK